MGCKGSGKVRGLYFLKPAHFAEELRLRTANILLINMRALANEIAKNLVLAGVGSMRIVDSETVVDDDLGSQFFVSDQHLGMNVQFSSASKPSPSTNA